MLLLSFSVIFSQQAVVWKSSRQSCFDFDKTVNGVWFNNLSLATQFFSPQTQVSHHVKRRFSELTVVQVTSFEVWKILVGNPSTDLNNVFGCKTVACFVFFYLCEAPRADALATPPAYIYLSNQTSRRYCQGGRGPQAQMMSYTATGRAWQNLNLCCCVIQHVVSSGCI